MNFTKTPPKQSGYYWVVNLGHPVPLIAFVSILFGQTADLYICGGDRVRINLDSDYPYLFGDEIRRPTTTKLEY